MGEKEVKFSPEFVIKSLVAGGVAGMCAKTTVAPLDRIKILLQAQSVHYRDMGVMAGLRKIVVHENIKALFKGNGAQMVRVFPYGALQFTCFEVFKKYLPQLFGLSKNSHGIKFVAGSLAGLISVTATFPLDTIRARLAFQVRETKYTGIINTGVVIFKTEGGVVGLYRGLVPTLIGIIPYAGLSFYCFEVTKSLMLKHCSWARKPEMEDKMTLTVPAKMLCGGLAGAVAQTASYPLDVARRRMQLGQFSGGMMAVLVSTYKEAGLVRGLFRGMSINYMRAVPMTAVSFSVYETMKQWMGLQTGLKIS